MKLEVYWLQFAKNKLEDIYDYYLEKAGLRVALELVKGIVKTTVALAKQPKMGAIATHLKHRSEDFRYLVFKNFKIIYWVNHDMRRVEIANVFDTRQDPQKLDATK